MVMDFRTIAIGQRWCGSSPGAELPTGALSSATSQLLQLTTLVGALLTGRLPFPEHSPRNAGMAAYQA